MKLRRRRFAALTILFAILVAGCATAVVRSQESAPAEATMPAAAPSPMAAEPLAPDTAPSDAKQAFVQGYEAYSGRDYPRAIERLTFAAANYPTLGDYALFYLGEAQQDQGDLTAAAATFERLRAEYPQSVLTPRGELALAQILLKLGRSSDASAVAIPLLATTSDPSIEQNARLVEAQALAAMGRDSDAYTQAMTLRESFPHGETDAKARSLAYSLRAANPAVSTLTGFSFHKNEAALLLREGQVSLALGEAEKALALAPTSPDRAEILWIDAQALHGDADRQKHALLEYLSIAPDGPAASAVLYDLALVYWKEDDSDRARATFGKIVAEFPASSHASGAMLRIGRIYEELGNYDAARSEYARLVQRYLGTDAAEDARFRMPWSFYMTRQYAKAAASFAAMRNKAESASEREMFEYWRARSLEKTGDNVAAHDIYLHLAQSVESNYYPTLAARRVSGVQAELPAAAAPDPSIYPTPGSASPSVRFHLSRILALRSLGISDLQAGEYRALESAAAGDRSLRGFILAGLQSADAWYDAIVAATRMSKNGHINSEVAERIRYPRAYWDLFAHAAAQRSLDPWLVLALARQESLFNPRATSLADARGLMQLMPTTADRVARQAGDESSPNLFDPQTNVQLGTTYLKSLLDMFAGDEFKAVAAYNGGEHAVQDWTRKFPGDDDEWVENIGYHETRDYVKKVIGGRREYLLLYGGESPAASFAPTAQSPG